MKDIIDAYGMYKRFIGYISKEWKILAVLFTKLKSAKLDVDSLLIL
jgi:hypothetical protein